MYDESDNARIVSINFGAVEDGTTSAEIVAWVWNKKNFSDAPTATDVRVSVTPGNSYAEKVVDEKWIYVKSDGIKDPEGRGIQDSLNQDWTAIGGSLLNSGDFLEIGDMPTNCARRLRFRIDIPAGEDTGGFPIVNVEIGFLSEKTKWLWASEEF